MKKLFTFLLITSFCSLFAQTTADFENFDLPIDSFLNGSDGNGGFDAGNVFLNNNYNAGYDSWTGWSISTTTDVTTAGFTNGFSSFVGAGAEGSQTYATSFSFGPSIIKLTNDAMGEEVRGLYISNATYPALSMINGDPYAKKFGGPTGDDPDYFLLTIQKYLDGNLSDEKVEFYLADYRFDDNSMDYIVDTWEWVDLTSLGQVDSLSFELSSTDNGGFGMNTPAYFCIDNLITGDGVSSTNNLIDFTYHVFPNPTADFLNIDFNENEAADYKIFDYSGRMMANGNLEANSKNVINLNQFEAGNYVLVIESEEGYHRSIFTKM